MVLTAVSHFVFHLYKLQSVIFEHQTPVLYLTFRQKYWHITKDIGICLSLLVAGLTDSPQTSLKVIIIIIAHP